MNLLSRWLIFAVARNESFEPMAQSLRITEEVVGNCLSGERKGDLSGTKKKRYGSNDICGSYGGSNRVGSDSSECDES